MLPGKGSSPSKKTNTKIDSHPILNFKQWSIIFLVIMGLALSEDILAEDSSIPLSSKTYFNLPTMPLSKALVEFSVQSGTSIIIASDSFHNQWSAPVVGDLPAELALRQMLAKSAFTFQYDAKTQKVVLSLAAEQGNSNENPEDLKIEIKKDSENYLEEIYIRGQKLPTRYTTITSSQLGGSTSLFDSTRFLSVVGNTLIKDQAPLEINEILHNVSGITGADGLADSNDDFYIRGFPRNALYWQGFRLDDQLGTKIMPALVEQLEVLKGPATLRYGQAEPGGIANVNAKSPGADGRKEIYVRVGGESYQQIMLDGNGSLNSDNSENQKSLLDFRFVYAKDKYNTYKQHKDGKKEAFFPSFRAKPTDNTALTLSYLSQYSEHQRNQGNIVFSPTGDTVDVYSLAEQASQASPKFEAHLTTLNLDGLWRISEHWHTTLSLFDLNEDQSGVRGDGDIFTTTSPLVRPEEVNPGVTVVSGLLPNFSAADNITNQTAAAIQSIYDEQAKLSSQSAKLSLNGHFTHHAVAHDLTFGADIYEKSNQQRLTVEQRISFDQDESGEFFITNNDEKLGELSTRDQRLNSTDIGFYIQDQITIGQNLNTTLGLRHIKTDADLQQNVQGAEKLPSFSETLSQLGTLYYLNDSFSLFANYSQGFKPNYIIDDTDNTIDEPELSHQYELGFKGLLLSTGVSFTTAIYQITKENIVDVQTWDGRRIALVQAERVSKGIDFDANFDVFKQLSATTALSCIDAEVTQGRFAGKKAAHVADCTANIFLRYQLPWQWHQQAPAMTFRGQHIGSRYGDDANQIKLDAYQIASLGVDYPFSNSYFDGSIQLIINNLFDKDYVESSAGHLRSTAGEGRMVTLGLSAAFH